MAAPFTDPPPLSYPSSYVNGTCVNGNWLYNASSALVSAAAWRGRMLAMNVHGPGFYLENSFIDVTSYTRVSEAIVQIPARATHVWYQGIFAACVRANDAVILHRIRLWDGGSNTTGQVTTPQATINRVIFPTPWTRANANEARDFQNQSKPGLPVGVKRLTPFEQAQYKTTYRGGDTRRKTTWKFRPPQANEIPGPGVYDWPMSSVVGRVSLSGSNLPGTNTIYLEFDAQGTDGTGNKNVYLPLLYSFWYEMAEDGF